jgi:Serine dehydrogenase proteinase
MLELRNPLDIDMEQQKAFLALRDTVASLERQRKSRIFCVIHAPDSRPGKNQPHICHHEYWSLLESREMFRNIDTLEVLVQSPGGHANIAFEMSTFFKAHCKRLHYLVPLHTKSAATIMCLNGDKIIQGEWGQLGPLDVQMDDVVEYGARTFSPLNEFKAMEFLRDYATEFLDYFSFLLVQRGFSVKQALHESIPGVTGIMAPLYSHVDPSKLGSYRRLLAEGEEYAVRLLQSAGNGNAKKIAERLVWKYPSHGFVINRSEARGMGLPVFDMEMQHDRTLIKLMLNLMESEVTYVGFITPKERRQRRTKPKATSAEQVPPATKRPVAITKRAV